MEISPNEAKQLIKRLYLRGSKEPVLLIGDVGIGKSVCVREAAEEIAKELGKEFVVYNDDVALKVLKDPDKYFVFVDFRLTEVEPSDLIGIPRDIRTGILKRDTGAIVYKPLLWARVLSKVDGLLFLDEITNVQRPDVQSTMLKIVLERKAGFIDFAKGVYIVSAGNSPEHSSIANYLPAPFVNRVIIVNIQSPTIEEWVEWMNTTFGDGWDKDVGAFLMRFPEYFSMKPDDIELLQPFAKPRTWTKLALNTVNETDVEYLNVLASGLVGLEAATSFVTFKKFDIPELEELNDDPDKVYSLQESEKYLLARELAGRIMGNYNTVRKLLLWLVEHDKELLMTALVLIPKSARIRILRIFKADEELKVVYDVAVENSKIKYDVKAGNDNDKS